MKKILPIILALFFLFILFSCTSYRYVDIQVLKPAEIINSYRMDKLYIINKQRIVINPSISTDIKYYKIFVDTFNVELEKKLKESPLFANSEIIITRLPELLNSYETADFETKVSTSVCNLKSFDILDSIDKLYFDNYWQVSYRLIYKLNIQFYNLIMANANKKDYLVSDTIYWESKPYPYSFLKDSINIDKSYVYKELATYVAESFASKIAPFWITQERLLFYNTNKYMRKAYNYYTENNLTDAIMLWKYVYGQGTKNLASKAAHNIALSYEVMDSLSLADEWIKKSILINSDSLSCSYMRILDQRLLEKELITEQLKHLEK